MPCKANTAFRRPNRKVDAANEVRKISPYVLHFTNRPFFQLAHSTDTKINCGRCTRQIEIRANISHPCDTIRFSTTINNNNQIDESNYKITHPSNYRTGRNKTTVRHFHGIFLNFHCRLDNCAGIAKHLSNGEIVLANKFTVIVSRRWNST